MKKYNVVLIGCGRMGEAYLEELYLKENLCLYGVADLNSERAAYFARKYQAKSWKTDYMEYMRDPAVDIIIAATYTNTHLTILKACASFGKHLICEKPVAANWEDTKEFVRIAKESGIKVQVGYILRFNKTYQQIQRMIQEGAIGKPIVFRMTQNHHPMCWEQYKNLLNDTSPLVDCGIHYIDVVRWFTGSEFKEVYASGARTESSIQPGRYNYSLFNFTLEDGSIGYYEAGWGNTVASGNVKEFIGPKGRIKLTLQMSRSEHQEEGDLIEYYTYPEQEYKTINVQAKRKPTGEVFDHLIKMIEEEEEAIPSMEDVYKSMEAALKGDGMVDRSLF